MRRALLVFATVTFLVASVSSAWAARPTITKFPKGDFDLGHLNEGPTGDVCPFDVTLIVHGGPGHLITFDGQGVGFAAMSFGSFRLEFTNEDTGESVTINSSGPGGLNGDGLPVLGRGPWVIFEPIALGGLRYFHGVTRFVPAPYGVHAIPIAGTEENLCDRLA